MVCCELSEETIEELKTLSFYLDKLNSSSVLLYGTSAGRDWLSANQSDGISFAVRFTLQNIQSLLTLQQQLDTCSATTSGSSDDQASPPAPSISIEKHYKTNGSGADVFEKISKIQSALKRSNVDESIEDKRSRLDEFIRFNQEETTAYVVDTAAVAADDDYGEDDSSDDLNGGVANADNGEYTPQKIKFTTSSVLHNLENNGDSDPLDVFSEDFSSVIGRKTTLLKDDDAFKLGGDANAVRYKCTEPNCTMTCPSPCMLKLHHRRCHDRYTSLHCFVCRQIIKGVDSFILHLRNHVPDLFQNVDPGPGRIICPCGESMSLKCFRRHAFLKHYHRVDSGELPPGGGNVSKPMAVSVTSNNSTVRHHLHRTRNSTNNGGSSDKSMKIECI